MQRPRPDARPTPPPAEACAHAATTFRDGDEWCIACDSPTGRRVCPTCAATGTIERSGSFGIAVFFETCPECHGAGFATSAPDN
jgi:DnaJ-class molecular chaperone